MTPKALENRLLEFSVSVIQMARKLPKDNALEHLSRQLIRSSSSPLLNYSEAQRAESGKDFIHKMRICLKELHESFNNLRLIDRLVEEVDLTSLVTECDELIRVFTSSIRTTERNQLLTRSKK